MQSDGAGIRKFVIPKFGIRRFSINRFALSKKADDPCPGTYHLLTPSKAHLCTAGDNRLVYRHSGNKRSFILTAGENYICTAGGKRIRLNN